MGSKKSPAPASTAAEWKRGTWKDGKYKNQSGTIFEKRSGQGPQKAGGMGAAPAPKKKKKNQMDRETMRMSGWTPANASVTHDPYSPE